MSKIIPPTVKTTTVDQTAKAATAKADSAAAGSPIVTPRVPDTIAASKTVIKSTPLVFRFAQKITDSLNSLFRTKDTTKDNMKREIGYANHAKKLFYANTDTKVTMTVKSGKEKKEVSMQTAILGLPVLDKPTADVLIYKLSRMVDSKKLTDDQAKTVMSYYLRSDRSQDFNFPHSEDVVDHPDLKTALKNVENTLDSGTNISQGINAILTEKLTTPQMLALGLSRGQISKEASVVLFRLSQGVVTAIKVAAVVGAVIGVLALVGVTFSNVYTIGIIAGLVGVVVGLYLLRGIYEAKSEGLLDTTGIMQDTLSKAERKEAKKEYDAALKAAQLEMNGESFYKLRLHNMSYWVMMMKDASVDIAT